MGYSPEQIEKGASRNYIRPKEKKKNIKAQRKKIRAKIKSDLEYIPHFNRYNGWIL